MAGAQTQRREWFYIHRALGTAPEGAVRVSPRSFDTYDDIDRLSEALAEIAL
jgi:selenocysteine lyase/cysteine desulfurase